MAYYFPKYVVDANLSYAFQYKQNYYGDRLLKEYGVDASKVDPYLSRQDVYREFKSAVPAPPSLDEFLVLWDQENYPPYYLSGPKIINLKHGIEQGLFSFLKWYIALSQGRGRFMNVIKVTVGSKIPSDHGIYDFILSIPEGRDLLINEILSGKWGSEDPPENIFYYHELLLGLSERFNLDLQSGVNDATEDGDIDPSQLEWIKENFHILPSIEAIRTLYSELEYHSREHRYSHDNKPDAYHDAIAHNIIDILTWAKNNDIEPDEISEVLISLNTEEGSYESSSDDGFNDEVDRFDEVNRVDRFDRFDRFDY